MFLAGRRAATDAATDSFTFPTICGSYQTLGQSVGLPHSLVFLLFVRSPASASRSHSSLASSPSYSTSRAISGRFNEREKRMCRLSAAGSGDPCENIPPKPRRAEFGSPPQLLGVEASARRAHPTQRHSREAKLPSLTCLRSRLPRSIHRHLDCLRVRGHLRWTRRYCYRDRKTLSCNDRRDKRKRITLGFLALPGPPEPLVKWALLWQRAASPSRS